MVVYNNRYGLAAIVLGALAWIIPSFLAGPSTLGGTVGGTGGMMGVGGIGTVGGGMFLWPLLLIGFVFLIFRGVVGESEPTTEDDALVTLRDRYARGEITDEEFEERKLTLQSQQDSRRRR